MVTSILAVGNALLITGIVICVCYYRRRKKIRMKSRKFNEDLEQSPQDTHPAPLASGNTLSDNISRDGVCNFNSSTNNMHRVFMY